jgi:hypothetical protein
VGAVLSEPPPADGESLGQCVVEGVGDAAGEAGEEVKTGMTWGERRGEGVDARIKCTMYGTRNIKFEQVQRVKLGAS